jgi:glycerol-3-phosphate dehydrogenase
VIDRKQLFCDVQARAESGELWDVIVVGGGATGLGCAVDAASRGLRVLLVEAHDFSKGTSSRSTKLVHGGVRYLLQGRLGLVREALRERKRMMDNAPHLVSALLFVVPVRNLFEQCFYGLGLKVYDWLAGARRIGSTRVMSRDEMRRAMPTVDLRSIRGGVCYYDAQFDDARFAIGLMRTLFHLGGQALNYTRVSSLLKEGGKVLGVHAQDAFTGKNLTLRAKAVVNATGVWVDQLRALDSMPVEPLVQVSQGVHVVLDSAFYPSQEALLLPKTSDGRVLFVLPWQGHVLIGTTDTPRSDAPLEPEALPSDIDFLLNSVGPYLIKPPTRQDVLSVFVGLRPLVIRAGQSSKAKTKSMSREHAIVCDPSGLVSVAGGKWTTYRSMAEDVIDRVCAALGCVNVHSQTAHLSLVRDASLLEVDGLERLHPDLLICKAEVLRAVRHEMAMTLEDVLARRSRALFLNREAALACIPAVRSVLRDELGYSSLELDEQERSVRALFVY